MPNVMIIRRWGNNNPGDSVKVDNVQARWLVDHAYGRVNGYDAPEQEAFMPGAEGSDPLASGDGTRRPVISVQKGERRDNNALPVEGSPVQYNVGVAPVADAGESESSDGGEAKPKAPARRRKAS